MKKVWDNIKENKWIHYGIIIVIGLILSWGLWKVDFYGMHDGRFHFLRLEGVMKALELGQFPPMITPDLILSYGYAVNLFYPPLTTYLPMIFTLLCNNYVTAFKIYGTICIVLSGITMYNLAYQITKKQVIALLCSIFYLIIPYKLEDVYIRYAIGEFTALAVMPIVFQGLYNLIRQDGKKHYYIAIGASLLVLSHTITTLYTAIFCIIYLLCNIKKLKEKQVIKKLFINGIFVIFITALFWIPMLEAQSKTDYMIFDDDRLMKTSSKDVKNTTIDVSYLLYGNPETKNDRVALEFKLGLPIVFALLLGIYAIRKVEKEYKQIYIIFNIFALLSVWMTTKYFPWEYMPDILGKIQFSWRMLGFFGFFASLVCGINIYLGLNSIFKKDIIKKVVGLAFVTISLIYTIFNLQNYGETDNRKEQIFMQEFYNHKYRMLILTNRDYLPIKAYDSMEKYMIDRGYETKIIEGEAKIGETIKNDLTMNVELIEGQKDTILEFPFIYYPGYVITIMTNDEVYKLEAIESEYGYVAVKLPNNIENGKLTVEYKVNKVTKISYILSLLALLVFVIYIEKEEKRNKGETNEKNSETVERK